jgi:hypothetical protein
MSSRAWLLHRTTSFTLLTRYHAHARGASINTERTTKIGEGSRPCAEDNEALDLIEQVTQRKRGRPSKVENVDNININDPVDNINKVSRPAGTSRQQALRKLRKSRLDLHAKVLKGKLSPHAAMIEAKEARPWKAAPLRLSFQNDNC